MAQEKVRKSFHIDRGFNTLMTLAAAAYAWQLYSWLVGIVVLVVLWVARRITANIITYRWLANVTVQDEEANLASLLKWTSRARWAWVIFAFATLAISAAEMCTGSVCKSIWE